MPLPRHRSLIRSVLLSILSQPLLPYHMVVGGPWGQGLHRQGSHIWLKVLNLPKVASIARFQPIKIHPCEVPAKVIAGRRSHRWKTSLFESDKIYGHQNARAILRWDFADTDGASAYWHKVCTYKLTAWPGQRAWLAPPTHAYKPPLSHIK